MKNVAIVCCAITLAVCYASAQSTIATAAASLTITPAGAGITITSVDCDVSDVIRGVTYNVLYDPAGASSIIHPAENGESTTDLGADIGGDPGQTIMVWFNLPATLTGSAGALPVSFGATSGVRVEDGSLFNPNVHTSFKTGTGGTITLRLGFAFTVPVSALSGDSYFGTVLTTAAYTGT